MSPERKPLHPSLVWAGVIVVCVGSWASVTLGLVWLFTGGAG